MRNAECGMRNALPSPVAGRPGAPTRDGSCPRRAVGGTALICAVLLLGAALTWAGTGGGRGRGRDRAPAPAPTPPPATAPAPAPVEDARDTGDEGTRLLSEMEQGRGATFVGRDPAYVVLPRLPERRETARALLNPRVVALTQKMMHYLLTSQAADGSWSDAQYPANTGVSALACLAIMAGGETANIGPNGKALTAGLEYLLKCAHDNGAITGQGSNPMGPMYEQCYATQALLYAYGNMPWRRDLRNVISKSLQLIERSQKLDGGWRYAFTREGDSDVSVTCNVLWVLRAGKKCGFTVNAEKVRKAVAYVESCQWLDTRFEQPRGYFRYRSNGRVMTPSMGGVGVIVLTGSGTLDHPMIGATRDVIAYDYRRYTIEDLMERRFTIFNTFYASLAMYMCGDEYWIPWYQKVTDLYRAMQRRDGEVWDEGGNTVYPTAMAAIVLQAPLGFLPIYER
jgi:hypothetical protein